MEEVLKERLSQIKAMSNKIEERFTEIENKQDETNKRLTKLETTIKNTINVKIYKWNSFSCKDYKRSSLRCLFMDIEQVKSALNRAFVTCELPLYKFAAIIFKKNLTVVKRLC